ncbi:copper amine oxidase N-terminal domain-containing protein [Ferviditalea candida]|uniref:Copper amine oxidase N-terminal domain-containing protein n=1 Tax=Ferviditalea candida TaxID=3108399 RepID=A0ABU5ZM77_9BACL|nr:copper amine oxidase N-terminal domain-containing protein [Paenibacillaceae bacterium T2]
MKKKFGILAVLFFLCFQLLLLPVMASATSSITWGEPQKVVYDQLYDGIFTFGDPLQGADITGMNLSTLQMTGDKKKIDLVISIYHEMAANGVVELGTEGLQDATDGNLPQFTSGARLQQGYTYLIVTADGSYAKIRIDQLLPAKVVFSFVMQSTAPLAPPASANQSGSTGNNPGTDTSNVVGSYELEEGQAAKVSWQEDVLPGDANFELYRSDNGGDYIKLTDFMLTDTSFVDKYIFVGHTYLYKIVAYDSSYNKTHTIGPMRLVIKPKSQTGSPGATKIVLQLDNKNAMVNGVKKTLDAAPALVDGRTLVPLRFIAEALGAKVKWDGSEQKISLDLNGNSIALWLNNSQAKVNGSNVMLDVPPQLIAETTMVPVRFVSENLKQAIEFDNATGTITITGQGNAQTSSSNQNLDNNSPDLSYFFHTWKMRIPGAVVTSPIPGTSDVVTNATPGADAGNLQVKSDGTYVWQSIWDGKTIKGSWRKTNLPDYPIILLRGEEGKDWKLGKSDKNTWGGGDIVIYDGQSISQNGDLQQQPKAIPISLNNTKVWVALFQSPEG